MDIHHNARTCPRSRKLIIQRVKEHGQSVQDVAQSLGISERTVYKWLARYRAQGPNRLVRDSLNQFNLLVIKRLQVYHVKLTAIVRVTIRIGMELPHCYRRTLAAYRKESGSWKSGR